MSEPCKKCGGTDRYANHRCRPCSKEYYTANRKRCIAISRKWHLANPDKAKQLAAEYAIKNKDRLKEYQKQYYLKNLERLTKYKKIQGKKYYLEKKMEDRMKLGSKEEIQSLMDRAESAGYKGEIREFGGRTTAKFSYQGKIDDCKDRVINMLAKNHKLKWYAQGYCVESDTRDICFDITVGQAP